MKNILDFLSELKKNNNRIWFAEHKEDYEVARSEFEQICRSLIAEIAKFDTDIQHVELKDCVFRIYRDIRFSNDKTPYKTHFGAYIASAGGRKSKRGGYYLHLEPDASMLSVGVWCPPPAVLKAVRQSIYDNIDELNEIRNEPEFRRTFNDTFYEEDKLKTVPPGFPKDFPDAELLKLKHFLVTHYFDEDTLYSTDFVALTTDMAKKSYPFVKFLNFTVDEVI